MKRLLALLPLPLALLVRLWARHTPETVERLFSQGVYPALAAPVSRAAALCPVPVFGLGVLALLGYILWSLRQGRWFRVLAVLGLAAAVFAGGWSLNYLRLPLEETLGLDVRASTQEELVSLCHRLAEDADERWQEAPGDGPAWRPRPTRSTRRRGHGPFRPAAGARRGPRCRPGF